MNSLKSCTLLFVTIAICCLAQGSIASNSTEIHTVSSSVIGVTEEASWSGDTLPSVSAVMDQGGRRTKSTKSNKDFDSKTPKGDPDDPVAVPSKTKTPEDLDITEEPVQVVKATGLTMTLGGVDPLDTEAQNAWEKVTRDFIVHDIMGVSTKLDQLEVSITFESQNPPYEGKERKLITAGVHGTRKSRALAEVREMIVQITFDVGIEIESESSNHDANRYVAHAFNSDAKEIAYMRKLVATGDSAFVDVGSVEVDAKLVPTDARKDAKEIGAIVGFSVMGFLCFFTICYIIFGTNASGTVEDTNVDEKDHDSDKHAKTETDSVSSDEEDLNQKSTRRLPAGMPPDDASVVSYYYDGNISVMWSMDTDIAATPRMNNSRNLLSLSRESSEGSLYVEDGSQMPTPQTPKKTVISMPPKPVARTVTPPPPEESKAGELYEV